MIILVVVVHLSIRLLLDEPIPWVDRFLRQLPSDSLELLSIRMLLQHDVHISVKPRYFKSSETTDGRATLIIPKLSDLVALVVPVFNAFHVQLFLLQLGGDLLCLGS